MTHWLLVTSYVFYGWWNPWYLLLLFGTSAIDYLMVALMERSRTPRGRRLWLIVSLVSNFGFLGYFKYSGFITESLNALLVWTGLPLALPDPIAYPNALLGLLGVPPAHQFTHVLLPIGISFHTFQSMSYTIDAYFGHIRMERSFVRFLAFVSFFPQLVAGPIERASNLLPQLGRAPRVTRGDVTDGLSLCLVGYFKKVALADGLSLYVDRVYAAPGEFAAPALLLATFAFAWQIYFDFSGYTDMARGLARLMGIRIMLNFNNPYLATGLGDFWNRWHISLSTWFKDYVYIPLGGNRKGPIRTYLNMSLTMIISGLWHGAHWTFVTWGAIHAAGRVVTRELERSDFYRDRVPRGLKQAMVFLFVCFGWIFFRAASFGEACLIVKRIFTSGLADPACPLLMLGLVLSVWAYQFIYESPIRRVLDRAVVRVGLVVCMLLYLAFFATSSNQAFIYFQF
jgi:D-alanyl-lipoteichoic acid acyltransferase DltB (MBOAT superfamily)